MSSSSTAATTAASPVAASAATQQHKLEVPRSSGCASDDGSSGFAPTAAVATPPCPNQYSTPRYTHSHPALAAATDAGAHTPVAAELLALAAAPLPRVMSADERAAAHAGVHTALQRSLDLLESLGPTHPLVLQADRQVALAKAAVTDHLLQ